MNTMAGKETGYKLVELLQACCPENESLFSCIARKKNLLLRKVSKGQRGSFSTEMAAFCLGCLKPVQSLKRQFNKRLMIFFGSYSFEFCPLGYPANCY